MSINTLKERDKALEELWGQLEDIPMNPETEQLEEPFMHFPAGTDKEDIWHWFDERYSKGIAYLLYGDGVDRTEGTAKLCYLKQLCTDCDSVDCAFCFGGECRFAMIHERRPLIDDDAGCLDYLFDEV